MSLLPVVPLDDSNASATQIVTVLVTGTNDAALLSADVRDLTETDSAADISASSPRARRHST